MVLGDIHGVIPARDRIVLEDVSAGQSVFTTDVDCDRGIQCFFDRDIIGIVHQQHISVLRKIDRSGVQTIHNLCSEGRPGEGPHWVNEEEVFDLRIQERIMPKQAWTCGPCVQSQKIDQRVVRDENPRYRFGGVYTLDEPSIHCNNSQFSKQSLWSGTAVSASVWLSLP
eukprot:TRINITY_DN93673_c0_g1_i1.p1 TRINITY_DN93673_c0_g1~~TRINITY_DN93673_c0_g1_i1.p1  ORF type:complete len:192 (-),score=3.30 TRINITY_DN93673_c0_g1_i1:494-1000(-)